MTIYQCTPDGAANYAISIKRGTRDLDECFRCGEKADEEIDEFDCGRLTHSYVCKNEACANQWQVHFTPEEVET